MSLVGRSGGCDLEVIAQNKFPQKVKGQRAMRMIVDLAGSEEIQSAHLAEALHAAQPSEVDDEIVSLNHPELNAKMT
ncbi:MAG: hypothetical protein JNJ96_13950 [Anaerolineales bacterium]|nr:hypothetical protein [Anaerolineales bacterium]